MKGVYAIRVSSRAVEAWSTARLPFEPKGWALAFRNELRASLREAPPVTGARLQAVYGAEDRGLLVDAENVLLYNVGSAAWRHLASQGVSFERSFGYSSPPQDSGLPEKGLHYHRYGFVESKAFTHWRAGELLASFVDVAVPSLAKPGPIWAAVRRQASPPADALATPVRFVVELTIGDAHPSLSQGLADQVKPALDGVISAFHTHRGETEVVSERLASSGMGEIDALGQLLNDPAWNILGSRTVVRPFGATGVQWNPADDMCVAATVQPANVDPAATAPRWRLTGKIHKAETNWSLRTVRVATHLMNPPVFPEAPIGRCLHPDVAGRIHGMLAGVGFVAAPHRGGRQD